MKWHKCFYIWSLKNVIIGNHLQFLFIANSENVYFLIHIQLQIIHQIRLEN